MTTPGQLVARSYDRAASAFAETADQHVYRILARPLLEAIDSAVDVRVGVVLDVAAGTGAVGRNLPATVALDVSIEQLRLNPSPRPVHGDARALPFCDDAFAAAVCGFGVNHVADPGVLLREMARVAPVVGVSTWHRPARPYPPKQLVFDILQRRVGRSRSRTGELIDHYSDAVGSAAALARLFEQADLDGEVAELDVEVPWPGVDAYLAYRLSMPSSEAPVDEALVAELREALATLPSDALAWRPEIVVGVGRRGVTGVG